MPTRGTLTAASTAVQALIEGFKSAVLQVTGTFVGTITFEASLDGSAWSTVQVIAQSTSALTTTTTAAGLFIVPNPGYGWVRARMSAYTSGTAMVAIQAGDGAEQVASIQVQPANLRSLQLAAATQTLTAGQSGTKFVCGAVDTVFTLPAASAATAGVWYEFECGVLSATTGLSISPNASDHIRGNGLTSTDDKDLINTAATDRIGDSARIYCDGVDGWVIEAVVGTWAKE